MPARTLDPEGGWTVMSHIGWGGEQTTICFKALRGSPKREKPFIMVWKPAPSKHVLKP